METKTLRIIQKLAKIGKILSKIISICCIVGIIGCILGIISISILGVESFKYGGVSIHSLIENSAEMSTGTMYAAMIVGLILCLGEAVIANIAEKYFRNELIAGTPFTFEGAREMLRLGICTVSISLGTVIASQIAHAIIKYYHPDIAETSLDAAAQVGIGAAFILVSLLCKLGAEKAEENGSKECSL